MQITSREVCVATVLIRKAYYQEMFAKTPPETSGKKNNPMNFEKVDRRVD